MHLSLAPILALCLVAPALVPQTLSHQMGPININGRQGNRVLGGSLYSTLTVTEIAQ